MTHAFRLGLFLVGTLLILVAGVFLISSRKLLFHSTYEVKSEFRNVSGLADGADVRIGGLHEGTVKHIELHARPDGGVTVVMDLNGRTRNVVKKDSVAAIKSEGLVGDKFVEISFGSAAGQSVKDGEVIASAPPLDISDLFKKTNQVLDEAQDAVRSASGAAANLESISAKADQGKGTLGAFINDKTVYQQAREGATAFQEDMEALKHNFLLRGFFKKRGYEDLDEVKKHEIARLPSTQPIKTFNYDGTQLFKKQDTAQLANQKILNDAGRFLEQNKFGLAVVTASTGMKGDSDHARQLSDARSAVVRDYVAQNFRFDDTRVKTLGLGKASNSEESDKIEIIIFPPPPATSGREAAHTAERP
jgi:phospholipid/cholesterol/gamma-HCH transport system substrate-binding protein